MLKIADYNVINNGTLNKEVINYGVKMIKVENEWKETMGEGIKVGIIDTGVDYNHEDLKERIAKVANFTNEKDIDTNGHGTHVAGIIGANKNKIGVVGVAPKCSLYIAKAFNEQGASGPETVYKSMMWLAKEKVDVINMSYSCETPDDLEKEGVNLCNKEGIIMVAAAGNTGRDSIMYPAKLKNVIGVTAIDVDKKRADYSSKGTEADIAAAGTQILSTYKNNTYAVLSGTSMATPLISGACAIIQAKAENRFKRKLTPNEMNLILAMYSNGIEKNTELGYGVFSFCRI